MKGINAKRIAALAAGAVLLGSSVIAASVAYEGADLVNANGQPVAKIVVGSGAAASDGVAAANIAVALANRAYKASTLTAEVAGQATCSGGGSGTGTCEVTDKKVTLDIEVPGVLGNAYQFKTLITDTLDKTPGNRINTLSEDNYTSTTTTSDVSTMLSPLRSAYGDTDSARNIFRIGGSQYSGFATKTISDSQAGSEFSYQVEQNFWMGSASDGILYDSGSSYRQVVAKPRIAAYNLRFLGNDYGVPFCTKADENNASSGNWAWCSSDTSSQYRTDNHRLRLPFMGTSDGWVISSMSYPSSALSSSTSIVNGGQVKLAKEAKYDIINVGGELDAGTMKIRLADISVATGSENKHPAIIDVLDAAGAVIGQIQVNAGETYTFTQSGTSNQIKVHVYRTAPGFTLNAKWAEVAIYTDEITLQDGQRYNLASSGDQNYNYKVSLLWKNKDYAAGSSNSTIADSLREIVIYDEDTFIGKKFVAGDTYNFPKKGSVFRMTYNGLDLSDGDYVPLTISSLTSTTYPVSTDSNDCSAASPTNRVYYTAKLIQFKTNGNLFGGTSANLLGDYMVDTFYYDPIGGVGANATNETNFNGTQNEGMARGDWNGTILYKPSGFSCYRTANILKAVAPTINVAALSGTYNTVRFETAGSDSGAYGMLYFGTHNSSIGPTDARNGSFYYQEDAGKNNTNSHHPVWMQFPFINTSDTWRFKSQDSSTSNAYYHGVRATSGAFTAYEPTLYTERGSKVLSVGTTDVQIWVAKTVGQPSFTFSPAVAEGEAVSTGREEVLKEGESVTLTNGVKITVKKITETVGSCVASATGSSPACTVNMGGVSAKIMPDNVASIPSITPYTIQSPLVMTDKGADLSGLVITVGGPAVNSVTAEALQASPASLSKSGDVVVKKVGDKIVVAGYTAADTMTAAGQFVNGLVVS